MSKGTGLDEITSPVSLQNAGVAKRTAERTELITFILSFGAYIFKGQFNSQHFPCMTFEV